MTEKEDRVDSTEIRQLRKTVHELADAVDALSDEAERQSGLGSSPEYVQAARQSVSQARDIAGPPVREQDKIEPPWERAGFETKEAWQSEKTQ